MIEIEKNRQAYLLKYKGRIEKLEKCILIAKKNKTYQKYPCR